MCTKLIHTNCFVKKYFLLIIIAFIGSWVGFQVAEFKMRSIFVNLVRAIRSEREDESKDDILKRALNRIENHDW